MTSEIRVNSITNRSGLSTVTWNDEGLDVVGVVTATSFIGSTGTFSSDVTISGDLGVAGTLTYEDVTRVDAIGLSTYREGLHIGPLAGIGLTAYKDGSIRSTGIITATTFHGSGANLTGIDATQIVTGNTSVQTVDTGSDGHVKINTEGSERLRIASDGHIFVANEAGTIDTTARLGEGHRLQLSGLSSNDGISVVRYSTSYGPWGFNMGRSKSGTLGTNTIVQNHNDLGHITFWGADGTDFNQACQISGVVDGTPSDGTDMPGRLLFKTTPDGSGTPVERLRITSAGLVGIGEDAPQRALHIGAGGVFRFERGDGTRYGELWNDNSFVELKASTDPIRLNSQSYLRFDIADSEKMRLTSAGDLLIGNTTSSNETGKLDIYHAADDDINNPHIRLHGASGVDPRIEFGTPTNSGEGGYIMYNDSDEGLYIGSRMGTYSEVNLCTGMNDGSPSSNARLTVNASGHILTPQQPVFHVQLEGHKNATQNPLIFTDIRVNNGSHYNSGNGRFTAPCSGMYYFFFQGIKNSNSGNVTRVYIQKNGSYIYDDYHLRIQEEGNYANGCTNWIVQLSANDYITLKLSAGGLHAAEYTHFGGYLIG